MFVSNKSKKTGFDDAFSASVLRPEWAPLGFELEKLWFTSVFRSWSNDHVVQLKHKYLNIFSKHTGHDSYSELSVSVMVSYFLSQCYHIKIQFSFAVDALILSSSGPDQYGRLL